MNPKRRRGAPPGNRNAYRHGFYSAVFKDGERRLLDQIPLNDLSTEIELLRVATQRFVEALNASRGAHDFEAQLTGLRAINLSMQSLASLLRLQTLTAFANRDASVFLQGLESSPPSETGSAE